MDRIVTDYLWRVGPFQKQQLLQVKGGSKVATLLNLITTKPNTLQDVPDYGVDSMEFLYTEDEIEMENAKAKCIQEITVKSNKYIEIGYVTGIDITTSPSKDIAGGIDVLCRISTKEGSLDLDINLKQNNQINIRFDETKF